VFLVLKSRQEVAKSSLQADLKPDRVATLFKVHKRTTFRWVEHGYLKYRNGLFDQDDIKRALSLWRSSTSIAKARKKLSVSNGTMRDWKKKGLLKVVEVFGSERVLNTSIEEILERRKSQSFSVFPGYVYVYSLLKLTGIRYDRLKKLISRRKIKSKRVSGRLMIPVEEFDRLKIIFDSHMRPAKAAKLLRRENDTIRRWIKSGRLDSIKILGLVLVSNESISREAMRPREKKLHVVRVPEFGKIRLFTLKQAAIFAKRSEFEMEEIVSRGGVRGFTSGEGKLYVNASSLKAYVAKGEGLIAN
jgi:predicted site-specific integrase-resolvase